MKWSYSRWSMYNSCPSQYEWHYILKKPRRSMPQAERGIDIHRKAEYYVKGEITKIPDELLHFKDEFNYLKKEFKAERGFTELDVSYNSLYLPTTMKVSDNYMGFIDYLHFDNNQCTVIDYKTGKHYDSHREQAHSYANACFILEPQLGLVDVEFWYLDYGFTKSFVWKNSEKSKMNKVWIARISRMEKDKTFKKCPNKFCGNCARNKKHGGDCDPR